MPTLVSSTKKNENIKYVGRMNKQHWKVRNITIKHVGRAYDNNKFGNYPLVRGWKGFSIVRECQWGTTNVCFCE